MTDKPDIFGLCIVRRWRSYERVAELQVDVVRCDEHGKPSVNGICGTQFGLYHSDPKCLECLMMGGQVFETSDGTKEWIAFEPVYIRPYQVNSSTAARMGKTLAALGHMKSRFRKRNDRQEIKPTEMFAMFAKFVNAKYVAWQDQTVSGLERKDWQYVPVDEGCEIYKREIERCCAEWVDPYKAREQRCA